MEKVTLYKEQSKSWLSMYWQMWNKQKENLIHLPHAMLAKIKSLETEKNWSILWLQKWMKHF